MGGAIEPKRALLWNLMRKKRWLWPFAALLALWGFCEFYDHVPKRSWFYRQTHTIALIDVTAKLEIDGEPLTLTRTIRCIRQPPVRGLARNWAAPDDMNVFDAVGGVTRTGRTFILNAPKACEAIFFNPKNRAFSDMLNNEHLPDAPRAHGPLEPISYSGGDLVAPVIYEPVGGRLPEKIIAYLAAPELTTTGNHGVKFVDLTISKSPRSVMLWDKTDFDMIREGTWYRPNSAAAIYNATPLVEWPEAYWRQSPQISGLIESCHKPCVIKMELRAYWEAQQQMNKVLADVELNVFSTEFKNNVYYYLEGTKNILIYKVYPPEKLVAQDGCRGFISRYSFGGDTRDLCEDDVVYVAPDGRVLAGMMQQRSLGRIEVWR